MSEHAAPRRNLVAETPESDHYWAALAEGRIVLPWCGACDAPIWTPKTHCGNCLTPSAEERDLATTGVVYSFTIVHRGEGAWKDAGPYVLAYVTLDDGPTIIANVDGDGAGVEVGSPVRLIGAGPQGGALFAPNPQPAD